MQEKNKNKNDIIEINLSTKKIINKKVLVVTFSAIFALCVIGVIYFMNNVNDKNSAGSNSDNEIQATKYASRKVGGNETIEYFDKDTFTPSKDAKFEDINDLYTYWGEKDDFPDYFEYACTDGEKKLVLAINADNYEEGKKEILSKIKNADDIGLYKSEFTMDELEDIMHDIEKMMEEDKDIYGVGIGLFDVNDLYYTVGVDVDKERLEELKKYMKQKYGDIVCVRGSGGIVDV